MRRATLRAHPAIPRGFVAPLAAAHCVELTAASIIHQSRNGRNGLSLLRYPLRAAFALSAPRRIHHAAEGKRDAAASPFLPQRQESRCGEILAATVQFSPLYCRGGVGNPMRYAGAFPTIYLLPRRSLRPALPLPAASHVHHTAEFVQGQMEAFLALQTVQRQVIVAAGFCHRTGSRSTASFHESGGKASSSVSSSGAGCGYHLLGLEAE
jgi:hypothetical protein